MSCSHRRYIEQCQGQHTIRGYQGGGEGKPKGGGEGKPEGGGEGKPKGGERENLKEGERENLKEREVPKGEEGEGEETARKHPQYS